MGGLNRIRWDRAGRLGGAGAVVVATVVAAPSLLKPGEPPPLDPDIGLVPTEPAALAAVDPAPVETARRRTLEARRGRPTRPHPQPPGERRTDTPEARRTPHPPREGDLEPATAAAVATPVGAPPVPAAARPTPEGATPGGGRESGPPEFGFER